MKRVMTAMLAIALAVVLAGCVERTIKITSQPSGAVVYLNDEEVGRTPTEVSFKFYGDYGVILRKEGFETLQTHRQINAPWYQLPPFDIVADMLIPTTVYNRHSWSFDLQPQQPPAKQDLLERAEGFRAEALGIPTTQPDAMQPAAETDVQSAPAETLEP